MNIKFCYVNQVIVSLHSVPMVFNPNEIKPTFLKLDSWSPGTGFYSYYKLQCIKLDKGKKNKEKKISFMHTKNIKRSF